jgi:arylformamidase
MRPGAPTIVDLSQRLEPGMPHGTTIPAPRFREVLTLEEHGLRCMELAIPTHLGTHLDAPSHFLPDGATIDQIPVSALHRRAVCVDVDVPADQPIQVEHLEKDVGEVQPGDALLIHTGWGERFFDEGYLHHPYLADGTASWIVEQGFGVVGVDTVTPDLPGPIRPRPFSFPVHHRLLGSGLLILENLRLGDVAGRSFTLVIGALNVTGADGAPARVLALTDGEA